MYNWITLLYSRNYHNILNQLYPNETLKIKGKSKWNKFKKSTGWEVTFTFISHTHTHEFHYKKYYFQQMMTDNRIPHEKFDFNLWIYTKCFLRGIIQLNLRVKHIFLEINIITCGKNILHKQETKAKPCNRNILIQFYRYLKKYIKI